jgi:hypothetical protein
MARATKGYSTVRASKIAAVSECERTSTDAAAKGLENSRVDYGRKPDVINQNLVNSPGALRQVAQDALIALVLSDTTPAAVKAACARTLLELCGAIGSRRAEFDDGADPETMSLADIDKRLKVLDDDML